MGEDAPRLVFLLSPEVGIPTEVLLWGKKNKEKHKQSSGINVYLNHSDDSILRGFMLFFLLREQIIFSLNW